MKMETKPNFEQFYKGKHILLTGGTGFMGKVLIEKLLRSCGELEKIYLLVRQKKGKNQNERFNEIFNCEIFEKLKLENPNFTSKLVLICGDCCEQNAGISEESIELLRSKVNIIFHTAAVVNFESSLNECIKSNTCGTKELLDLATSFKSLESFVFVSTAFSNGFKRDIKEEVYNCPVSPTELIRFCQTSEEELINRITPSLIEGWPNTYTFSKCITENLLLEYEDKFPIGIIRPSQVVGTAFEPIEGWIGNYYGPTGMMAATGVGVMRTTIIDKSCLADMVPCDMAINLIIAVPWSLQRTLAKDQIDINKDDSKEKSIRPNQKLQVFNCVSGDHSITYGQLIDQSMAYVYSDPSDKSIWSLILITTTSPLLFNLLHVFLHLVPAFFLDTILKLLGKKPRFLRIYDKIKKLTMLVNKFTTSEWRFDNKNVQHLWEQLSTTDKQKFKFNINDLDWNDFVPKNARGIRLYIVQDKKENNSDAHRKYKLLRMANVALWTFLSYGLYQGISKTFILFSFICALFCR